MKTKTSSAGKANKTQKGYTFLALLMVVALLGILGSVAEREWSYIHQKSQEEELLFRGMAIQKALQSYLAVDGSLPRDFSQLLQDPRFPERRHLRQAYGDPFLPLGEWTLVKSDLGGIQGVHSNSALKPLRKVGFPAGKESFAEAETYQEWYFGIGP